MITHMYVLPKGEDSGVAQFREAIERSGLPLTKIDQDCELNATVIEGGMQSGRPSIMMWWETDMGVIAAEMSLDQLIMLQIGMEGMATTHFGFERK